MPTEAPALPSPTAVILLEQPTATLVPTATPELPPQPSLAPDPESSDLPDYYGGLVITLDHVGQTITMKPGQGFLLRLGNDFEWVVEVSPGDRLTINRKITPEVGEQGVYIARKRGPAVLSAVGKPLCTLDTPPCSRPSVLFQLKLDIQ